MGADNASGAGMERLLQALETWTGYEGAVCIQADVHELLAHNAKLEAQVERLREALVECIADLDYLSKAPDSAYARPDDTTIANAMRALKP